MKTVKENWNEIFEDKLNEQQMIRVRGGENGDENPDDPIVK
jgi:hypothetical protein